MILVPYSPIKYISNKSNFYDSHYSYPHSKIFRKLCYFILTLSKISYLLTHIFYALYQIFLTLKSLIFILPYFHSFSRNTRYLVFGQSGEFVFLIIVLMTDLIIVIYMYIIGEEHIPPTYIHTYISNVLKRYDTIL